MAQLNNISNHGRANEAAVVVRARCCFPTALSRSTVQVSGCLTSLSHSHAILALPSLHLSPSHIPPSRAHHCVASATWLRCFWDDPCCEILKLISVSDRCFLSVAYYNTSASQLEVTWACADVLETPAGYFIAQRSVSAQIKPNLPLPSQSILRFKFWTNTVKSRIAPIVVYFKISNRRHLFIYWDEQFYSVHHSSSFYKTIKIMCCSMGLYIRNLGATPPPPS